MPQKQVLLRECEEVVGKLLSVYTDGVIVEVRGRPIKVSMACEEALRRLKRFLGQEVGILRLGGHYHIRKIKADDSVNETPTINSKKTGKMQHFRLRKCCNFQRSANKLGGVSIGGYLLRGVSNV